jgi:hypothetical protein
MGLALFYASLDLCSYPVRIQEIGRRWLPITRNVCSCQRVGLTHFTYYNVVLKTSRSIVVTLIFSVIFSIVGVTVVDHTCAMPKETSKSVCASCKRVEAGKYDSKTKACCAVKTLHLRLTSNALKYDSLSASAKFSLLSVFAPVAVIYYSPIVHSYLVASDYWPRSIPSSSSILANSILRI